VTEFHLEAWQGGYAAYSGEEGGAAARLYLLAPFASDPPGSLSLAQAWSSTPAWALIVRADSWNFATEPPADAAGSLALGGLPPGGLVLAWKASGDEPYQSVVTVSVGGGRQTLAAVRLALCNVRLAIPESTAITLRDDGNGLRLTKTTGSQFTLDRSDQVMQRLSWDGLDLPTSLDGSYYPGGLAAAGISFRARTLFLLGQDASRITADTAPLPEIRFWLGDDPPTRIRLPLFDPVDTQPMVVVDFALNPALPYDPSATRFELSGDTQRCFASPAGLTTLDGKAVGLEPVSGIGFHFAPGFVAGNRRVYLAPFGRFALKAPSGAGGPIRLMPGLSGLEYIEVEAGDFLELLPAQPAYGKPAGSGSDPPQLTSACTTSWARLVPAAGSRGYHAQPLSSVFYASTDGKSLPRAADAKVSDLDGAEAAYPLAPYGRIFDPSVPDQAPAAAIGRFERTYLAGIRGSVLGSGSPPVFSIGGAVLQKGATPRGLMADIGPVAAGSSLAAEAGRSRETATPPGQCRRLYLGKGETQAVTLEPNESGIVDPLLANALLQPDLFLVYNNWQAQPIGLAGELDVGGFSFKWVPEDPDDRSVLFVAKFSTEISLQDWFAMPDRWRNADIFVGNASSIEAARKIFQTALDTAKAATTPGLFEDFLTRIAGDPRWRGFVAFQARIDGNAMPPTLQILLAGIDAPLRAHHVAVDVSALTAKEGVAQELGPSAVAGVISYDRADPGKAPSAARAEEQAADPPPPSDYGFFTQSLKVGIFNSTVTTFHAEVALAVPWLFGRTVTLDPGKGDPAPNTFPLKGVYHVIGGVPTVTFQLPAARRFSFAAPPGAAGGTLSRVLKCFDVETASILPQIGDGGGNPATLDHHAQITLGGQLWFAEDPFGAGVDLFSFGTEGAGLPLDNYGFKMTFDLAAEGLVAAPPRLSLDYSRLAVRAAPAALRPGGMVGGLPFKLKGIMADDAGLDLAKLGGKPVQVLQLAGQQVQKPHFALQFELIIGSLGELSGVHAALTSELRLGWGPLDVSPDADGALLTIQLPGASGGFDSLNVQGMLKLVFGEANLMQVPYTPPGGGQTLPVYAILFNNVALSVIGIKLPPKVVSDLILFSDPANATGSNLAGCLAVRQQ
jgi:hypothetical protein